MVVGRFLLETSLPLPHPGVKQDPTHNTGKDSYVQSWQTHTFTTLLVALFNDHNVNLTTISCT